MITTRFAVSALGAACLVLGGLGALPAHAASSAADPVCTIKIVSVQANDLQEDKQGNDEISLRLGDTNTVQRSYVKGQKRNTLGDGRDTFVTRDDLKLIEHDPGSDDVLASASVPCANASDTVHLSDATGDAIYTVTYDVDVLP